MAHAWEVRVHIDGGIPVSIIFQIQICWPSWNLGDFGSEGMGGDALSSLRVVRNALAEKMRRSNQVGFIKSFLFPWTFIEVGKTVEASMCKRAIQRLEEYEGKIEDLAVRRSNALAVGDDEMVLQFNRKWSWSMKIRRNDINSQCRIVVTLRWERLTWICFWAGMNSKRLEFNLTGRNRSLEYIYSNNNWVILLSVIPEIAHCLCLWAKGKCEIFLSCPPASSSFSLLSTLFSLAACVRSHRRLCPETEAIPTSEIIEGIE